MTNIRLTNISVQDRLAQVSMELNCEELVVILGPNGAGKSTLIKTAMGLIKPETGKVSYGGKPADKLSALERARHISYLPQIRPMAWPNIVQDVVALGRFSHGVSPGKLKPADKAVIDEVMEACGITHLSARNADTLSGGETARMHCARAFAGKAPLLIADEPVAALDPRHQFRIMDLIASFVKDGGGALIVLHDVGLAAQYADRLVWMKDGQILAHGPPEDTLTPERLAQIYGVRANVTGRKVHIEGEL